MQQLQFLMRQFTIFAECKCGVPSGEVGQIASERQLFGYMQFVRIVQLHKHIILGNVQYALKY